jgi:hypothetical protein
MTRLTVNRFLSALSKLTETKERVYLIGLLFTIFITLKEVICLSYNNFQIFSYGSIDFWKGINPYSDWNHLSILGRPLDRFLYAPLFSILFTPFAILPRTIGVFCWNIFTYTLYYFSVFTLPDRFSFVKKRFFFFFSALLLFSTLLSVQFNPVIAAIFLFSFTLLEKRQGFWAVLLICLSGFTKLYGIFQIIMLFFYPRFWRNALYALLISIIFFFLPVIRVPINELLNYYHSWIVVIANHLETFQRYSIFRPLFLFHDSIGPFTGVISFGVLFLILLFTLIKLRLFKESFLHRSQFLGILMGWIILFSTGSERHTYVIAVVGYAIWYSCSNPTRLDKVLLWINLLLLGILPVDLICPWVISNFVLAKLNLGVIVFSVTWGIMVYKTFTSRFTPQNLTQ